MGTSCPNNVGYTGLQQMLNKSLVDGFNVDKMTSKPDCRACIESKKSEEPFQKQSKRKTVPGELTHIDLWGKYTQLVS